MATGVIPEGRDAATNTLGIARAIAKHRRNIPLNGLRSLARALRDLSLLLQLLYALQDELGVGFLCSARYPLASKPPRDPNTTALGQTRAYPLVGDLLGRGRCHADGLRASFELYSQAGATRPPPAATRQFSGAPAVAVSDRPGVVQRARRGPA